jgi:hypothetical protein
MLLYLFLTINRLDRYLLTVACVIRVTISWYDPPGVSNSAKALIHDLDLVVFSPDRARKYLGNGGSSFDRLNNNEQVYVENPPQGLWKVGSKTSYMMLLV